MGYFSPRVVNANSAARTLAKLKAKSNDHSVIAQTELEEPSDLGRARCERAMRAHHHQQRTNFLNRCRADDVLSASTADQCVAYIFYRCAIPTRRDAARESAREEVRYCAERITASFVSHNARPMHRGSRAGPSFKGLCHEQSTCQPYARKYSGRLRVCAGLCKQKIPSTT